MAKCFSDLPGSLDVNSNAFVIENLISLQEKRLHAAAADADVSVSVNSIVDHSDFDVVLVSLISCLNYNSFTGILKNFAADDVCSEGPKPNRWSFHIVVNLAPDADH